MWICRFDFNAPFAFDEIFVNAIVSAEWEEKGTTFASSYTWGEYDACGDGEGGDVVVGFASESGGSISLYSNLTIDGCATDRRNFNFIGEERRNGTNNTLRLEMGNSGQMFGWKFSGSIFVRNSHDVKCENCKFGYCDRGYCVCYEGWGGDACDNGNLLIVSRQPNVKADVPVELVWHLTNVPVTLDSGWTSSLLPQMFR